MRRMRYLESGDAIRGWGVLLVIIGHSGTTALLYSLLNGDPAELLARQQSQDLGFERLFDSRQAGAAILATQLVVFLFFALSAYLLGRPFIAAMFGEAKRAPTLRLYARHRLGRVVPLFWVVILITIVLFGTEGSRTIDIAAVFAFSQTWTAAPFNQNILQAWTMNVEMAFYIALPIIAGASAWIYARGGRFAGWYALLPMAALATFAWIFANTWLPATTVPSQSVIGGLLTFIPGILIAVADVRWGDRIGRWKLAPLAAIGLVIFGILLAFKQSSLAEGGSVGERNIITIAAGAMLAGFVLWQLTGRKTWPFMMWKFPRWVGERSFSIYLMHGIALFQLQSVGSDQDTVGMQFLVLLLAAIPVSIFYGAILYALVERPSTRLARGERPLFGDGPVTRTSKAAPTVGTTPTAAMGEPQVAVHPVPTGAAPAPGARGTDSAGRPAASGSAPDAAPVPTPGGTGTEADPRTDGSSSDVATAPAASDDRPRGADRPPSQAQVNGLAAVAAVADRPAWKRPWLGGDGARGLGALLVFVSHVVSAEGNYQLAKFPDLPGRDIKELFGGDVGFHTFFAPARLVNLFFAFSAYLLARPFIAWALNRTKRPGTAKFYTRRVLRIMPAYWATCALVVLWLVVFRGNETSAVDSLKTLLLLDGGFVDAGFHHSWTLPIETAWTVRVEVLGYLLLPFLAWGWFAATRRFGFRGLVAGMVALLALTLFISFWSDQTHKGPGLLQWLFLPGLTVAVVEAYEPLRSWIARRRRKATLWALLASFLLLVGSEPASSTLATHLAEQKNVDGLTGEALVAALQAPLRWGNVVSVPMQFVGATGMLLCFIALEWQGGRPPIGLDRRIPRWFGERSYSFYLVHFAVIGFLLPHVLPGDKGYLGLVALGLAGFAVSLALTVVLFRFVEMPGMLLASRLTGRRPPGPLSVAPAPEVTQAWRGELAQAGAGNGDRGADRDPPDAPGPDAGSSDGDSGRDAGTGQDGGTRRDAGSRSPFGR